MTQRLFSLSISTAMWSKVAMQKRYGVNLTDQERAGLQGVVRARGAIGKRQRAQILLKADEGLTDSEIAEELAVDQRTVERVRERCCTTGLQAAVEARKPARPPRNSLLDGKAEARLVEIACTEPPDGRAKWTLSLLANRMVELRVVDSVSKSTICRGLKKTL